MNEPTTSAQSRARTSACASLTRSSAWLALAAVLVVASIAGVRWVSHARSDRAETLSDDARSSYSQGKFDSAITELEQAVELDPGSAGSQLILAQAYEASGRLAKAEAAYSASLQADPNQPQALYNLAIIHKSQGKQAGAIQELKRAIHLEGTFVAARVTLAELYAANGDNAAARKQYAAVLKMKPYGADLEAIRGKLKGLE